MTLSTGMPSAASFFLAASEVSLELGRSSTMRQSEEEVSGEKRGWGRGMRWALVRGFVGIFFRVRIR